MHYFSKISFLENLKISLNFPKIFLNFLIYVFFLINKSFFYFFSFFIIYFFMLLMFFYFFLLRIFYFFLILNNLYFFILFLIFFFLVDLGNLVEFFAILLNNLTKLFVAFPFTGASHLNCFVHKRTSMMVHAEVFYGTTYLEITK